MVTKNMLFSLSILLGVLAASSGFMYEDKTKIPILDPEAWWGPADTQGTQDDSIWEYKVKFNQDMIDDLRMRLRNTGALTPPLEGANFTYGFNSDEMPSWAHYICEEYPFKEREDYFNQMPHFQTYIQGLKIHFIHIKPEKSCGKEVIPLLMLHGYPGSVREFYETIEYLREPSPDQEFVFELVVPSLPGYGFSDGAVRPGLGPAQIGVVFINLMKRLGHDKFYLQGGDFGAIIAGTMVTLSPNTIMGYHSNMLFVTSTPAILKTIIGSISQQLVVLPLVAGRYYPIESIRNFLLEEMGYFHMQATKCDTIGVALLDSPAGLLAYFLQNMSTWTHQLLKYSVDGGLLRYFDKKQIIDNFMVYWSTKCITTSMRIYAEYMSNDHRSMGLDDIKTAVPVWSLQSLREPLFMPVEICKVKYTNIIGNTILNAGGHFVAWELPKEFAEDVFKAVGVFRRYRAEHDTTKCKL